MSIPVWKWLSLSPVPATEEEEMSEPELTEFERELTSLINKFSLENDSDTPDFLLAAYLRSCLEVVAGFIRQREKWYGRRVKSDTEPLPPPPQR